MIADCQHRLENNDPNDGAKYSWGPGSILVAVGMVMMCAVTLGSIILVKCAAIDSAGSGNNPKRSGIPDQPIDGELSRM